MFNSHYKSNKHKDEKKRTGDGVWQKNLLFFKFGDLREARSMYTKTNALTCTSAVYRGSLEFMVPELIIEELSIASAGINELGTVDVRAVSMTFFTISNPDNSYPFQNDLKNIPNKVTSNMKAASK